MTDAPCNQTTIVPAFLKRLEGYPGAVIESLDELGSAARVFWAPDREKGKVIFITGCRLTAAQLRQMADMMDGLQTP